MHLNRQLSKAAGLSLIEALIALGINVLLLAALMGIFATHLTNYNKVVNADSLNQQLQTALQVMSADIRRAGYWANASSDIGTGLNNNPFMAAGTDLTINAAGNCILFAYDNNKDNTLPAISTTYDDERYGFRLSNQTLQARPPGAAFSCTAAANAWENMTDPSIVRITNLQFTLSQQSVPIGQIAKTLLLRTVTITITGQVSNDANVTKTLTQLVRIRNDKFVP